MADQCGQEEVHVPTQRGADSTPCRAIVPRDVGRYSTACRAPPPRLDTKRGRAHGGIEAARSAFALFILGGRKKGPSFRNEAPEADGGSLRCGDISFFKPRGPEGGGFLFGVQYRARIPAEKALSGFTARQLVTDGRTLQIVGQYNLP